MSGIGQIVEVIPRGKIEDSAADRLQVDFANKFVGGGVIGDGCVQVSKCIMVSA
jgi:hypothetical protein